MKKIFKLLTVTVLVLILSLSLFACNKKNADKVETETVGDVGTFSIKVYYGTNKDEPYKTFDSTMAKDMALTAFSVTVNKADVASEVRSFKGISLNDVYTKLGLTIADTNTSIEFFSGDYHKGFSDDDYKNNSYYIAFYEKTGDTYEKITDEGPAKIITCLTADNTTTSTKAWVKNLDKIVVGFDANSITLKSAANTEGVVYNLNNINKDNVVEKSTDITKDGETKTYTFKVYPLSDIVTGSGLTLTTYTKIKLTDRSDTYVKEVTASDLTNLYIAIAVKNSDGTFTYYDEFNQPYVRFYGSADTTTGNWVKELKTIEFYTPAA